MTKTAVGADDDDDKSRKMAAAMAGMQPTLQRIMRQLAQTQKFVYQPAMSNLAAAVAATQTPAIERMVRQLAQTQRVALNLPDMSNLAAAIAATQTPAIERMVRQLAQTQRVALNLPDVSKSLAAAIAATQTPAFRQLAVQLAQVQQTLRQSPTFQDLAVQIAATQASTVSDVLSTVVDGKRTIDDELEATANLFNKSDALTELRDCSAELFEDPAGWLEEADRGATTDDRGGTLGEAARYLLGCFVLLAQRLNPRAETIERYASAVSIFVLLLLTMGMLNTANPKLLGNLNAVLGTPAGIVGVYLALRPRKPVRRSSHKHKLSATVRRNSKPLSRKMRRRKAR